MLPVCGCAAQHQGPRNCGQVCLSQASRGGSLHSNSCFRGELLSQHRRGVLPATRSTQETAQPSPHDAPRAAAWPTATAKSSASSVFGARMATEELEASS